MEESARMKIYHIKGLATLVFFLLMLYSSSILNAQSEYLDSLLNSLEVEKDEFERLKTYNRIGHYYQDNGDEKAFEYYNKTLELSTKLDIPVRIGNSHYNLAYSYLLKSDYDNALDQFLQAGRIYEEIPDSFRLANALRYVANMYSEINNYEKSDEYYEKANVVIRDIGDQYLLGDLLNSRGVLSNKQEKFGDALKYYQEALDIAERIQSDDLASYTLSNIGLTYKHQGDTDKALEIFYDVLERYKKLEYPTYAFAGIYNNIGSTLAQMNRNSEAREALETSIELAKEANASSIVMEGYKQMAESFGNTREFEKQVHFLQDYHKLKDSLFTIESENSLVKLEADYQIEQKNSELLVQEAELTKQRNQRNIFLILSSFAVLLLLMLAYFYSRIKGVNNQLEKKNNQIEEQNDQLEKTLRNLKSTQAQLIQSEKMASLGELTAGIAHEIQNPLNFVNNFSDVNTELIEELIEEISSTPLSDQNLQEARELAADIKANEEKIKHHGGRADSIVKGMLQHSRTSTGEKVPTDINALADEYLRLAYHGLRAKDNTFSAKLETDFDDSIGKIQVIPQDIGRVLLNIFNNAFYACAEKSHREQKKYIPLVTITTKKLINSITLTVTDNGIGMSKETLEKIFQPFYTTKPTGSGTGLGMSISYDIIKKGHGGEIKVKSTEGEGTIITITVPTTK